MDAIWVVVGGKFVRWVGGYLAGGGGYFKVQQVGMIVQLVCKHEGW